MASISSSVATVSRTAPAQANMVAPFTGLKSNVAFPTTKKANDFSTLPSNGGRVQCMKVWPPLGKNKITTMASISSSVATVSRTAPAQANMVAPFTGLKANAAFPTTKKSNDFSTLPSNGGRVQCMKVWPPLGKKKYETLSYLPTLTQEQLAKEVDYLLRNKWVPCLEFELEHGFVYRLNHRSPGYYDGRYWTMWKLPMFGCTDSAQVLKELEECKKEYPTAWIRIIGFDNVRQVQCISFIASKPDGY